MPYWTNDTDTSWTQFAKLFLGSTWDVTTNLGGMDKIELTK